ncbi:hypothetical protein NL676_034317 [Syzygium grande]|nr:hypothetical protein NL676_034317 [Syzygium grande]
MAGVEASHQPWPLARRWPPASPGGRRGPAQAAMASAVALAEPGEPGGLASLDPGEADPAEATAPRWPEPRGGAARRKATLVRPGHGRPRRRHRK